MNRKKHTILTSAALLSCLAAAFVPARADNGLATIDNPGGGTIVYGPLDRPCDLPDALVTVLHAIHGRFGAKPEIGKLFQTKGSNSVATFFTLNPASNASGPIEGMIIVTTPTGALPAAAMVYDSKDHFGKSVNEMLKTLNVAWAGGGAETAGGAAETARQPAPVPMLRVNSFPDGSGSISLPEGWHITRAARGGVHADGPNGEAIHLGVIISGIYDTRNPRARADLNRIAGSGKPYLACPPNVDLASAYRTISAQILRMKGKPADTLTVTRQTQLPANRQGIPGLLLIGELDPNDGTGPQKISMRMSVLGPFALGQWSLCIDSALAPAPIAEEKWPTLIAICNSWRQDGAVIGSQTQKIIDDIHETGKRVDARIAASHAANDAHNSAVYKHWDNMDKYSQSFQNYQFDRAVVKDIDTGEHGTMEYKYAAALVEGDPNRYQYVLTPDFIKGKDY